MQLVVLFVVPLLSLTSCLSANTTLCAQCSFHGICDVNSSCICLPNWSNTMCNNFTNPCANLSLSCANNATCHPNNISPNITLQNTSLSLNYTFTKPSELLLNINWNSTHECNCSSSYSGVRCELERCESAICYNHGDCLFDTVTNKTICDCHYKYNGTRCGDCLSCSDGSSIPDTTVDCNNGFCEITGDSYTCHCSNGYTGEHCSDDIDECNEPGICNYGMCSNSIGNYHCDCSDTGYTGLNCNQEVFECNSHTCENGGMCKEVDGSGYQCNCVAGWSGDNCGIDINDCEGVVCQNEGICDDKLNSYLCTCSQGYEGTHCESAINYCKTNPCIHGDCNSLQTSYSCDCYPGYAGEDCNENINECSPNPCVHGSCIDGVNNFTCQCNTGYTGETCGENIDDCYMNPCGLHGNCTDLLNNFTCSCDVGYNGEVCENLINYCMTEDCSNHGSCTPSNCTTECSSYTDFFSCTCNVDFTGKFCEDNIDHCLNNNCSNGVCAEETGGYTCMCNDGFSGEFCTVNESSCIDNTCYNGSCIEHIPKYVCECYVGFEGGFCETKINYCDNTTCNNGTCMEEIGDSSCLCDSGYYGEICQNIDLCYNNNCINGNCTEINNNSYSCVCDAEFSGEFCNISIHSCYYKTCANNGSCLENDSIGECVCGSGYTGELCEEIILECESEPCLNGGECTGLVTGYNCTCPVPYIGNICEIELNSCVQHLCNLTLDMLCVDTDLPNNSCYCSDDVIITSCMGVSYLCDSHNCNNNGICSVIGNSPECICPMNYTGDYCQYLTDPCLSNPCMNNEVCSQLSQDTFECVCSYPYTGEFCESMVVSCNDTESCSTIGSKLCISNFTQETCQCHPAYYGTNCSQLLDCPTGLCTHISCCIVVKGSFSCSMNCSTPTTTSTTTHPTTTTISTTTVSTTTVSTTPTVSSTAPPYNPCDSQPCNHGDCTAKGDNFTCECSLAYTGDDCNTPVDFCYQVVCGNEGVCENDTYSYICKCEPTFYGDLCLFESPEPEALFQDCGNKTCKYIFNNGYCDMNCAEKESCLFDGLDCLEDLKCTNSNCETIYGNKACDKECDNEPCLFDGGDCLPDYLSYNHEFSTGSLIIIVKSLELSYAFSDHSLTQILYHISKILHTIVIVEYISELDNTVRVERDIVDYEYKYKIVTNIENSLCRDYCYRTTEKAADHLNAYLIDYSIDTDEYTILQITSNEDTKQTELWPILTGASIVAVILLLIIGTSGVIIRKKRPRRMYFPRRLSTITTNSERAALVDAEDPDPISKYTSVTKEEHNSKRIKLDLPTHSTTSSNTMPDSKPPPYEYFNQEYIPNALFHPLQEHKTYPQTSIELDQLLVGSLSTAYPIDPAPSCDSVNVRGIGGYTPLSLAVIIGSPTVCGFMPFPALPILTSTNSNINQYQTTLNSEMLSVEDLLRLGADVNLPNDQGATPLHLAAMYSRSDVAGLLIVSGAHINPQDRQGRTPLHTAVASGAKGVFQILIANRNLNIDHQSIDGSTALMLAARHLNNDLLYDMLSADANANLLDKNGYTALHWAAAVDNAVAIQTLITHSADIDYPNFRGETPLFLAAKEGSTDCVKVLLQNAASSQITDFFGRYPIVVANERLHQDIEFILDNSPIPACQTGNVNTDTKHNLADVISKGTVSKSKTESKRIKKLSSPSSKVHPFTPSPSIPSDLSSGFEVKVEASSPSPMLHNSAFSITVMPNTIDYSDCVAKQIIGNHPLNSASQLTLTHPYPTPPTVQTELSKHLLNSLSDLPYPSHYPSPESSINTISPINLLNGDIIVNHGYPNHLDVNSLINQRNYLTDPDWDEFGCS
ncbi:Notch [Oopsacas minuta]|uniref:Notch n=1 Tax=Oopsacas minuta TaxID=111878 RepID=A0AAV7K0Q6_9METZ|nr:Notch [Oopsacas minuta]